MKNEYGDIPSSQLQAQKKYFYGSIIALLYMQEEGYPLLGARIQTLINQVLGSNAMFGFQPEVLSIVSSLETARREPTQFRKAVLDAANLVDALKDGDNDV